MENDEKKLEALRKRPMSNDAVELLATLVDRNMIICQSSAISFTSMRLHSLKGENSVFKDKLPFKLNPNVFESLYNRGYLFHVNREVVEEKLHEVAIALGKELPTKPKTFLAWYDQPYAVTKEGRKVMEDLRGRLIDILAERENAKECPRLLVTANAHYNKPTTPGVSGVYRIIRETEGRFYVAELETIDKKVFYANYNYTVKGSSGNHYVEKSDVVAIDVTMEQYNDMKRATLEFEGSLSAARNQMETEIAPIQMRYAQRREQLIAMLEDGLREAVEVKGHQP
jgi:hypothetical protein